MTAPTVQVSGVLPYADWQDVRVRDDFLHGLLVEADRRMRRVGPPAGMPRWRVRYLAADGRALFENAAVDASPPERVDVVAVTLTWTRWSP